MKENDVIKALDILERFDFFGGQRAGRELWSEKPVDIQNEDIKRFSEDIAFLKEFINSQKAEIAELQSELIITKNNFDNAKDRYYEAVEIGQRMNEKLIDVYRKLQTAKSEAYKEFAERLKERKYVSSDWSHGEHPFVVEEVDIDEVLDEMESERE